MRMWSGFDRDAFDFGEAGDVNHPIGSGPITQRREEVRAARQNLAAARGPAHAPLRRAFLGLEYKFAPHRNSHFYTNAFRALY